jgi:hypothetical protein
MESYYHFIKRTEPKDSPVRKRLERIKAMLVKSTTVLISINGKKYEVSLNEAQEIASSEGVNVVDLLKMNFTVNERNGGVR